MNIWPLKQSMLFGFIQLCSAKFNKIFLLLIHRHIQEDLQAQQIPTQKSVDEMTDEEKNYFYFKVHDLDGNDKLDGLEIFYSATHHSETDAADESHQHEHEEHNELNSANENNNIEIDKKDESEAGEKPPNDGTQNSSVSNVKLLEINENDEAGNKNLNHIIGKVESI